MQADWHWLCGQKEFGQGHGFRVRLGTRPQVRIQDLGKGAAPASEAESCWHSEVELCEWSESFVARVQGPLNGPGVLML